MGEKERSHVPGAQGAVGTPRLRAEAKKSLKTEQLRQLPSEAITLPHLSQTWQGNPGLVNAVTLQDESRSFLNPFNQLLLENKRVQDQRFAPGPAMAHSNKYSPHLLGGKGI